MNIRKNPRANLEPYRKLFFEIGLIVTLLFVFAAFEYRSYESHDRILPLSAEAEIIEIEIPITRDKKEVPKPPPPRYYEIKINEDNIEDYIDDFPDDFFDDNAFDDWVPYERESDEESIPDDIPVRHSEKKALYPGGLQAMYLFLSNNIVYPEMAKELGVQGIVYLDFIIEKDGSVSNVAVVKGIGFGCDEEAVRVVSLMPKWEPARQNGRPVRLAMVLPVRFTLR
jgi:protein TonB